MRGRLLGRIASADPLASLPTAMQAEMPGRCQPVGQDCESLLATPANSASRPKEVALIIVALTESSSVADNRVAATDGTSPRQEVQRDHPGSMLSFASGSAIKRITVGVKARR